MANSIYYDISGLLSQRCVFHYVIGNRGGGKTFSGKKLCINRFKKNGDQFVWVRRYYTEIETLSDFWADIRPFFPKDDLSQKGDELYINGELAGYLIALSTSMKLKSVAFPRVKTIIMDEFIIDKGRVNYIRNEAQVFMELYETIARMREGVVAIFFGNAISVVNPYFDFFGIAPDLGKRYTKKNGVCIEFYFNDEFIQKKESTAFGQIIKGTAYGEYNMKNKFLRDSDSYITARPETASNKLYQFIFDGDKFSLWQDYKYQRYYIDRNYEPRFGEFRTWVSDPVDMKDDDPSMIMFKKNNAIAKRLCILIERGDLYFCDQSAKQKFYEKLLTNY